MSLQHTNRLEIDRANVRDERPWMRAFVSADDTHQESDLAPNIGERTWLLRGERKLVTVLFADIVDSTSLIAGSDPEDAYELLQPAIKAMRQAVRQFDGTVNQILGDGIMALFGAPIAHEDHARRACHAALAIQETMSRFRAADGPEENHINVRIGLATGEVVVKAIRNDLEFDYRAIGDTVHIADRMQSLASSGGIVATRATRYLADAGLEWIERGPALVKGLTEPVRTFELAGQTRGSRPDAGESGVYAAPLFGRDKEMAFLRARFEDALVGQGSIGLISGVPGIGKTRLLEEFLNSLDSRRCRIVAFAPPMAELRAPLLPVTRILESLLELPGRRNASRADHLELALRSLSIEDEQLKSVLAPLFDEAQPREGEAGSLGERAFTPADLTRAVCRLLRASATRQPVVLVLEDIHWYDIETRSLLESIGTELSAMRVLLLCTHRPATDPGWKPPVADWSHELATLSKSDSRILLGHLLGEQAVTGDSLEPLVGRAEGIPFYAEELASAYVESGTSDSVPATPGTLDDRGPVSIPSTIQSVIAARVDRLPAAAKGTLLAASVIGREVSLEVLRRTADLPPGKIDEVIDILCTAGFLRRDKSLAGIELAFRHSVIREVTYRSLLRGRRRELHEQVLEAFCAMAPQGEEPPMEQLAFHSMRAERWRDAVEYNRLAGANALARTASGSAIEFYQDALSALAKLSPGGRSVDTEVALLLDLANAHFPIKEKDQVFDYLRRAETVAVESGDELQRERILSSKAMFFIFSGEIGEAIHGLELALGLAQSIGDRAGAIKAQSRLGVMFNYRGEYRQAVQHLHQSMQAHDGDDLAESFGLAGPNAVTARAALSWAYGELGELGPAMRMGEQALQLARRLGNPFSIVYSARELGIVRLTAGDPAGAKELLSQAGEQVRANAVHILGPPAECALGYALALLGQPATGLQMVEHAIEDGLSAGALFRLARLETWRGEVLSMLGRPSESIQAAERAIELATRHEEHGHLGWAKWLMGDLRTTWALNDLGESEQYLIEAGNIARAQSMPHLEARTWTSLAHAYHAGNMMRKRDAAVKMADQLFTRLGTPYWQNRLLTPLRNGSLPTEQRSAQG